MKKLLIATAALITLSATAAQAEINLDIGLGEPAYVEQPVVVEHPYLPAHYNGRDRHREGRDWRVAHEENHDNGRHLGEIKHDHR